MMSVSIGVVISLLFIVAILTYLITSYVLEKAIERERFKDRFSYKFLYETLQFIIARLAFDDWENKHYSLDWFDALFKKYDLIKLDQVRSAYNLHYELFEYMYTQGVTEYDIGRTLEDAMQGFDDLHRITENDVEKLLIDLNRQAYSKGYAYRVNNLKTKKSDGDGIN